MVVLILFTLVCLFALIVNVGHRITKKMDIQNTADAATYSGAIWQARGLNLVSMLNVGMSETLGLIMMTEAYESMISNNKTILQANLSLANDLAALPQTSQAGAVWLQELNFHNDTYLPLLEDLADSLEAAADPHLWSAMTQLQNLSMTAGWAMPAAGQARASQIAQTKEADSIDGVNEADGPYAFLFPNVSLPVTEGQFHDLCPPTLEGGLNEAWLGWDKGVDLQADLGSLFTDLQTYVQKRPQVRETLARTLSELSVLQPSLESSWQDYINGVGESICASPPADAEIQRPTSTSNFEECLDNQGTAQWRGVEDLPVTDSNACTDTATAFVPPPMGMPPDSTYQDVLDSFMTQSTVLDQDAPVQYPASLPRLDSSADQPTRLCQVEAVTSTVPCPCFDPVCQGCSPGSGPMGTKTETSYLKTEWILLQCNYMATETFVVDQIIPAAYTNSLPRPILLMDNWQDISQIHGFVRQQVSDKMALSLSEDAAFQGGEQETFAVSRARIYNPIAEDLFNQNWQVTLSPVSLNTMDLTLLDMPDSVRQSLTPLTNLSDKSMLH